MGVTVNTVANLILVSTFVGIRVTVHYVKITNIARQEYQLIPIQRENQVHIIWKRFQNNVR